MGESEQGWRRFLPQSDSTDFRCEFGGRYAGETVCVAGAGGYIGSSLVRALGLEDLRSIILLEASEHGLFQMQRHMKAAHPRARCEYVLGNVNDARLVNSVLRRFSPRIVFHAAAFKHVALLEHNPFAAIENNVLATQVLAEVALEHGVSTFVLLSTDKAANPHSIMGVSKRLAELVTVSLSGGAFAASAIRLGNVIGSTGSVVPLFREQMAHGGPLWVTDPLAARYFLTKEQAVTAILAAGAARCDGTILIPELGAPVLVADLARFLSSTSSGNKAPSICFTGLQPGEKLTEDLMAAHETRVGTVDGPLTVVSTGKLSLSALNQALGRLKACIAERDYGALRRLLKELVPEYVPSRLLL